MANEEIAKGAAGTAGTSTSAPIIDLSPSQVPKRGASVAGAVFATIATTIGGFAIRSGTASLVRKKMPQVSDDAIDAGIVAGGVGLGIATNNTYARAAGVGLASAGLLNIIVRRVPRLSNPFNAPLPQLPTTQTESVQSLWEE